MKVSSRTAKSLTGDDGTLKLPSKDLDCSWSLVQQLVSQLQQLGGNTGPSRVGICAPEWRDSFSTKKRPMQFRQHCACETRTMLQEESTISFTFSLSLCTSQSNISFHDKEICFYFCHMKNKKAHKTKNFFLIYISAKPIHWSVLLKLSTVPADFSLPQCCNT